MYIYLKRLISDTDDEISLNNLSNKMLSIPFFSFARVDFYLF